MLISILVEKKVMTSLLATIHQHFNAKINKQEYGDHFIKYETSL